MAIPLTELIPVELLPTDQIKSEESPLSILERILVTRLVTRQLDPGPGDEIEVGLTLAEEVVLSFPGLDGVALVLGGGDTTTLEVLVHVVPDNVEVRISGGARLRFSRELLRPVVQHDGKWIDDPSRVYSEIGINTTIIIDQDWTISFDGLNEFALEASMIADSGCVIEGTVAIDLSESQSIPETIAMGLGDTWRGLILKTLMFHLPDDLDITFLPDDLTFTNFCIGSGGISGSVSGNWTPQLNTDKTAFTGNGAGVLFDIPFALREVAIEFKQNTLVESKIEGALILPFFDQPIFCEIRLTNEGNFTVAVSADQTLPPGIPQPEQAADGLFVFTKQDLLELKLKSIAFEKRDDVFSIKLGGDIKPLLGGLTWPSFEVKELSIDSRGRVTIDGGWIDLPKQLTMDFYGFSLEVSKIGFGSEDDGSRWIGFSGGLKLCEGLPMSGAVEGLRIYWKGSDFWLEFKGAELAFEIPDSIAFAGRVEFIEDPFGPKRGFKGGGKLRIIPSGLELNAEVVIGKNMEDPSYTFFFIFIDTQLPAGIPLFSTGVSLYGIAGLFAYNMEPNKTAEQAWYDDWYKKPTPDVSSSAKWKDQRSSLALGAGVTLGTAPDNGYAVNAKTLLVLVLPGPILMIEGKAGFLQERSELSDEPPFRALLVLDGRVGQLLLNIEAQYPTPSDSFVAKLIHVQAGAEAFFDFNNASNMHLFIGQKDPRAKRIRAEILSLFEANAYFMLFPTRFEIGAWIGYDARWKFGPVKIRVAAWMDGNALVSWIPVQFKGDLTLFGEVSIKVFGIGFGLSIGAGVAVAVPIDYRIFAELYVKISLPWPLPDPKVHVELEWKKEVPPPTPIPLGTIGIEHLKVSEKWQLERYPQYETKEAGLWTEGDREKSEPDKPEVESPIVPLDAKIVLSFVRPMIDAALIGWPTSGVVSPERVGDYEFRYRLVKVTLEKRAKAASSDSWETVACRTVEDTDADKEKLWGSWLALDGDTPTTDSSQVAIMSKLMLFGKSPFEYARETTDDTYYDNFSEWNPTYGMSVVFPPKKECFGFDDIIDDKGFDDIKDKEANQQGIREIRRGDVIIIGENLRINQRDTGNGDSYLDVGNQSEKVTVFIFPESIRQVEMLVGRSHATCSYYNGAEIVGQRNVINGGLEPLIVKFPETMVQDFNLLVFHGPLELFRLCYITAREADRFIEEEETANHAMSAAAAYRNLLETEIFLPNTFYRLTVDTEAQRREVGQGSWNFVKAFRQSSYFQTGEPPGICEPSSSGGMTPTGDEEHYPERGPLRDLRQYVSKVMPAEGTQAFYRSYDVGAEFNEPYVELMYVLAGKPLAIYLYDNNGQGDLAPEGEVAAVASSWEENTEREQRRADVEWKETLNRTQKRQKEAVIAAGGQQMAEEIDHPAAYSKVPDITLDEATKQNGVWSGGEDFVLKPNMLYRAALIAMVPRVVIPFTIQGEPIIIGEKLQYTQVTQQESNLTDALEDNYGQSESGMKVISDGQRIIVTDYKASDEAKMISIDRDLIDDVIKETLEPSEPKQESKAVFSWSFFTSRFTSFVHHIHSFVGATWDLRATLGPLAWPELTQQQRNELKILIESTNPQREEIYRKSIELFALRDHPLPERLEIQVLKDSNGPYGFLIESPEPIQWRHQGKGRVTLEVRRAVNNMESPLPAYGPVKIIDCDLLGDWLEILVQTDIDLSGYKIERIDPATDTSILPDVYYTFGPNSKFKAGTVIRINTHSQPNNYVPSVERKDIFIGTDSDILSNTSEMLRIIDATGREIHRRQFAPREFEKLQTVIASDSDGTRTFVFLRDSSRTWISQLPDGTYWFQWAFRRNAGGGLPILRRRGSTAPEEATLEFNLPAELP